MATYTTVHVVLSVIGIGGALSLVVLAVALVARYTKRLDGWTMVFLASTAATSVTGFGFPFDHLLPSHVVGALSLVVLAVALVARYTKRLAGPWRTIYVVTAAIALYFNVFVLIVQAFLKIPALRAMAPTQSEPPFAIAQLGALALFVVLTIAATRKFRLEPVQGRERTHV